MCTVGIFPVDNQLFALFVGSTALYMYLLNPWLSGLRRIRRECAIRCKAVSSATLLFQHLVGVSTVVTQVFQWQSLRVILVHVVRILLNSFNATCQRSAITACFYWMFLPHLDFVSHNRQQNACGAD